MSLSGCSTRKAVGVLTGFSFLVELEGFRATLASSRGVGCWCCCHFWSGPVNWRSEFDHCLDSSSLLLSPPESQCIHGQLTPLGCLSLLGSSSKLSHPSQFEFGPGVLKEMSSLALSWMLEKCRQGVICCINGERVRNVNAQLLQRLALLNQPLMLLFFTLLLSVSRKHWLLVPRHVDSAPLLTLSLSSPPGAVPRQAYWTQTGQCVKMQQCCDAHK